MRALLLMAFLAGCDETQTTDSDRPALPDNSSGGSGDGGGSGGGNSGGDGGGDGGGNNGSADDDGDGLTNAEEAAFGTNPDNPDSDKDGFEDGEEVNVHGTNPAYSYSHPYAGGYNVGWCEDAPTGAASGSYRRGDVAANFTLTDQHGEQVDLYSFCGQYVLIAFGASWCGPCQTLAAEAQRTQDRYADDGFQFIEVLFENSYGGSPSNSDLNQWANHGNLETVPVLADSSGQIWSKFEQDGYIPTTALLGPDMEILTLDQGTEDPSSYLP